MYLKLIMPNKVGPTANPENRFHNLVHCKILVHADIFSEMKGGLCGYDQICFLYDSALLLGEDMQIDIKS